MNPMFAQMLAAGVKLPYKRRLTYLEGTGTQYINTGKYAPRGTDIEITFVPSELATMSVFGGRNGQQIRSCALLTISDGCRFDCGSFQSSIASGHIAAGKRYKFTYTDNVNFAIDDLETGDHYAETLTAAPTGPSGYPLALFAMNTANTKSLYFAGRIYEWKYWENGALAQHLIPVLDWHDVPCMYDRVSGESFYNQGSGQFRYWPVEEPIDGEYGVWLKQGTTVISSGMKMTGANITTNQSQNVYRRGIASACVISGASQAYQYIFSGGTAIDCVIATSANTTHQVIYSGGVASGTIASGIQHVSNGGLAVSTTAHYRQYVSSGGTALDTIVSRLAGGAAPAIALYAGGVVSGAVISSGGSCWIQGGFAAAVTAKPNGGILLNSQGSASGIVLSSGGSLVVSSGGTALAVTSHAGATITVAAGGYIEYA